MSALDPWFWAEDLMDVCVAALDTLPAEVDLDGTSAGLRGAPERRYFSDGEPSFDCPDMLTIHLAVTAEDPQAASFAPSLSQVRIGRVNLPAYVVTIVRCRPASMGKAKAPPIVDLNRAAKQHQADLWVLWNAVWRKVADGSLFDRCQGMTVEAARALDPEGLASGWILTFAPALDGYDPIPDYVPLSGGS